MRVVTARSVVTALAIVAALATITPAGADSTSPSDWPQYHRDDTRSGAVDAGPTPATVKRQWASRTVDGEVYAEPLIANGLAIVATENNTVYAFDAATGKQRWRRHLGTPVNGGDLPCGNIDPSGITSTPVIDAGAGVVYVVTFTQPAKHTLVGLDLATGKVKLRRAADAPGSDPTVEQQRPALSLLGGHVLVPFGGLFGDCGDYHGYIVGIPTTGEGAVRAFQVPAARAAAIWTPSGVAIDDSTILAATGNATASTRGKDLSNSVIRLSEDLQVLDSWTPRNQHQLSSGDIDLGQIAPVALSNGRVFMVGKAGTGYLLDGRLLGGSGGQLFDGSVCDNGAWGGTAAVDTRVFVACGEGLVAVDVQSDRFDVAWRSEGFDAGPPIVTGDVVWSIDGSGARLRAFRASDGKALRSVRVGAPARFATPSASDGTIYVAAGRRLLAFR